MLLTTSKLGSGVRMELHSASLSSRAAGSRGKLDLPDSRTGQVNGGTIVFAEIERESPDLTF